MALFLFGSSSQAKRLSLGVYIWSGCFEKLKVREVARFIEAEGIERIELSYRPFIDRRDVRDLAKELYANGKEVDIVLSEPKYIFPERWHEVKSELIDTFKSGFDVHLDIEPHILPDFKEKKEKYLELFVRLLERVHLLAQEHGRKVSVAISVSHYRCVISSIFKNSDLVVFMVYGAKNLKKVDRIVNPYRKSKIALALRAKDFESEKKLIGFIGKVNRLTGINIFIIQNLRDWEELR